MIEYERFGGLSPALMNSAPPLVLELSVPEAAVARGLIPPEFYSLAESPVPPARPDVFRYRIAVEDEGRRSEVTLGEHEIPDSLRPLLDWLGRRARRGQPPR
jgi:hypothetical protein